MKINYVEHDDGTKLFSFTRHDYKTYGEGNDFIMIDGGFDYTRYTGECKSDDIENLITDIRQVFYWGQNYDKDNNRLKETQFKLLQDLTTDHIIGILLYFTRVLTIESKLTNQWLAFHEIFLCELKYRINNK